MQRHICITLFIDHRLPPHYPPRFHSSPQSHPSENPTKLCLLTSPFYTQEIKFGDNDTLSAITSSMIHADYLFLLTDVDGLYTSNPRKDPTAKLIEVVASTAAIRSQGSFAPSSILPDVLAVCVHTMYTKSFLFLW